MSDLAERIREEQRELNTRAAVGPAAIDTFEILDHLRGGLVAPRQQQPTLATISAGFMGKSRAGAPIPVVSRDGTIHVNGKEDARESERSVPGLFRALQRGGFKKLTVAFPFDDPRLFIQMRYAKYTATSLELYGDEHGLTRITTEPVEVVNPRGGEITVQQRPVHTFMPAESDEYAQALQEVKTQVSLYFLLAEWTDQGARVTMPDGVGLYRLRMTSRNSLNGLVNYLRFLARLTGGRLAGVPVDLFLEKHDVTSPDGTRRDVPIWQAVMRPPDALALTTNNFQDIMAGALEQGARLRVLPPPSETVEDAMLGLPEPDLDTYSREELGDAPPTRASAATRTPMTQADVEAATRGSLCNPEQERARFFQSFNHTPLRDQPVRAEVIRQMTNGRVSSLRAYLADATESEARALYAHCNSWWERYKKEHAEAPAETRPAARGDRRRNAPVAPPRPVDAAPPAEPPAPAPDLADLPERPEGPDDDTGPAEDAGERPGENLDALSLYRDLRDRMEGCGDTRTLGLAWQDVQRNEGALGTEQLRLLRETYATRAGQLSGAQARMEDMP